MSGLVLSIISAFWLGILTSISPCPLATNIAAVSFIGRRVESPFYVVITGLIYTLGRAVTYTLLGVMIVNSLLSMPVISHWLQKYMHKLLGPILIVVAMFLLGLLSFSSGSAPLAKWCQEKADKLGLLGALFLGVIFALSFCPVSAALFFGSLVPLAVERSSGIVLPFIYGFGTAVPVLIFAVILAFSASAMAKIFSKVSVFELWARRITGVIFLLLGFYFTLAYTIGLKHT